MIVKNIKNLCRKRGISLSGLEKQLGFGNSTISKWLKSSPTIEKLSAVAEYFDVSVDELLKPDEKE